MPKIPTDEEMHAERRRLVCDLAVMALSIAPEGLSCVRLAELIGTSPHCLHRLLGIDDRFLKSVLRIPGSRAYRTHYRLTSTNTPGVVSTLRKA